MTKLCSIEGCNNKHHGKGYCKAHYNKYIMKEKCKSISCAVEGCNDHKSIRSGKLDLCEKHFTRLKRHGNTCERKRNRSIVSIVKDFASSEDKMKYEFSNLETWSVISKLFYGNKCSKCGWNEGPCEAHHITPKSKGGLNTLMNCEILCPNCHSLAHKSKAKNRFSEETLAELKIILKRH